jgi:hypothetical protein
VLAESEAMAGDGRALPHKGSVALQAWNMSEANRNALSGNNEAVIRLTKDRNMRGSMLDDLWVRKAGYCRRCCLIGLEEAERSVIRNEYRSKRIDLRIRFACIHCVYPSLCIQIEEPAAPAGEAGCIAEVMVDGGGFDRTASGPSGDILPG